MRANLVPKPPAQPIQENIPVVRFPLDERRPHWKDLLPRRWRRRVVIQGRQFVL
jgi:hypothetical protein